MKLYAAILLCCVAYVSAASIEVAGGADAKTLFPSCKSSDQGKRYSIFFNVHSYRECTAKGLKTFACEDNLYFTEKCQVCVSVWDYVFRKCPPAPQPEPEEPETEPEASSESEEETPVIEESVEEVPESEEVVTEGPVEESEEEATEAPTEETPVVEESEEVPESEEVVTEGPGSEEEVTEVPTEEPVVEESEEPASDESTEIPTEDPEPEPTDAPAPESSESSEEEVPEPEPTEAPVTEAPQPKDCTSIVCNPNDREDMYHAHPSDCGKWCQCDNFKPVEKLCPGGLHFNTAVNVCDWPAAANCQVGK
ncbi:cell surface glycoprotein 1 [Folsomia candida]|uniref:Zinc metalloprotease ZmpB n=1 Tax=Folsomia candida TaxID=158441 RepID=A0A226DH47_FOLCA|nr:cell surface glycoprotein 1 [Folsomia candida]OXA44470.1 Zinc metalloprotease ZmpB [Folsomia candida]